MPYREKTAWLALIAMALTFGPYFTLVSLQHQPTVPMPNFRQLAVYAIVAITQAILLGIGHLVLRHNSPDEARIPPDERDRAITDRSRRIAYYVLMTGTILVGVVMPFSSAGWEIVNAALFMIVIAEVVHYASVVVGYRRQA